MKKLVSTIFAGALTAGFVLAVSPEAKADGGRIAAGVAGGLIGGALFGGALAGGPVYAAPPPPPEYYAPAPVYIIGTVSATGSGLSRFAIKEQPLIRSAGAGAVERRNLAVPSIKSQSIWPARCASSCLRLMT